MGLKILTLTLFLTSFNGFSPASFLKHLNSNNLKHNLNYVYIMFAFVKILDEPPVINLFELPPREVGQLSHCLDTSCFDETLGVMRSCCCQMQHSWPWILQDVKVHVCTDYSFSWHKILDAFETFSRSCGLIYLGLTVRGRKFYRDHHKDHKKKYSTA